MNKSPAISVIIAYYNQAQFLADAINSVLQQEFEDYEIIVVDDCATTTSRALLDAFKDRIIPVFMSGNSGQGAIYNTGFAHARGEIICLLDANDLFVAGKLQAVMQTVQSHPNAGLIYHQGYRDDHALQTMFDRIFPQRLYEGNYHQLALKADECFILPASLLSFRRSLLEEVMPLTPFLTHESVELCMQMVACLISEVAVIQQPLSIYRHRKENWFVEASPADFLDRYYMMQQIEKEYYYTNKLLIKLGAKVRVKANKQRVQQHNLFVFAHIGWLEFIWYSLRHFRMEDIQNRFSYLRTAIAQRRDYHAEIYASEKTLYKRYYR